MNAVQFVSSAVVLSTLSTVFAIAPVQAQDSCAPIVKVAADTKLREIRADKFGIGFKMPRNYRAITSTSGKTQSIRIINPGVYDYLQCAQRNQVMLEGFQQSVLVTITPTNGKYQTVNTFINTQSRRYNTVKTLKVGGQTAVLALRDGFGITAVVTVLSPDRQFAVEVEAEYNGDLVSTYDPHKVSALPELKAVVETFQFGAKSAANLQTNQSSVPPAQVATTLRPLIAQIRAELPAGMAMRLPTQIEGVAYDGRKFPIYGKILPPDDDQFTIQLVATPACDVRACLVGYLSVAPLGSDSLPSSGDKVESINLTSTLRGKYLYRTFPGSAASPPVNIIVWQQAGFAYVVSSFMNKQKVLDIAQSMANGVVIQSQR
ncbi:MAG: hypothetical protein KME16_06390 [Scytolyngbya sp. HA4215-MV1]|jgi:hypothetical protein|nr:hypothetical protein [Scytolyngbya sp. HA4215-MV1]